MTASPAPARTREGDAATRDFVREMAWGVAVNANIVDEFVAQEDNVGATYAAKRMLAYAEAVRDGLKMLGPQPAPAPATQEPA